MNLKSTCLFTAAALAGVSIASAAPVPLQQATATFSQGFGGGIDNTIDGLTTTDGNGWAIAVGVVGAQAQDQTAAYETVTDGLFNSYTFTLFNEDDGNGQHTVGKFRLSVTTDDRSLFADGADSGGDVTANWIQLTPSSAAATNGTTLTINSDHTILASGTNPAVSTYTITANSSLLTVTGFRLEVFEDPSLPEGGPGRPFNGNFVLTEFQVDAVPEPASLGLLGLGAGALLLRRRR